MRYTSTRSSKTAIDCSFEEALTCGYASDGGLFVPSELPRLTGRQLRAWSGLAYPELMYEILRLFIAGSEVSDAELKVICDSALVGFVNPAHAVPMVPLHNKKKEGSNSDDSSGCSGDSSSFFVAELFHGPTFCFKDLGMRPVINLLSLFATKRQRNITLLVSTTGDTGPAAVQAVADCANDNNSNSLLKIAVHYPQGQISDFQRKQLTTDSPCVRVICFEGGGDDMDQPIKNLLSSRQSSRKSSSSTDDSDSLWSGVNSYNIGRPIAQMVHHVWTYLRIAETKKWTIPDDDLSTAPTIDVIVPTGAMGNVASGYMMKKMGLPIRKFVTAVNTNDITHQVVQTGAFDRANNGGVMHKTLSDAINIQVPYNFERLLYYLTDGNHEVAKDWYAGMAETGRIDLGESSWLPKLQDDFDSARVADSAMCETARVVHSTYGYLADPHTAVALSAAYQLGYLPVVKTDDGIGGKKNTMTTAALLATASPCKFQESVVTAVGDAAWAKYFASADFPAQAKRTLDLPERPPIFYPRGSGADLESTQRDWEERTRTVVAELERAL